MTITDLLKDKQAIARELTRELDRSIAIEQLWPEAFEHGRVRAYWVGKQQAGNLVRLHGGHYGHEYHITDSKEECRMFAFNDVPNVLGGGLSK